MKKYTPLKNNQYGLAILHILPAFVLVAAIAFVGGSVYQNQIKKRDAARQAAQAEDLRKQSELTAKQADASEEKEVDVPAPAPEQKPVEQAPAPKPASTSTAKPAPTTTTKTKPSYTYVGISSVSHNVSGDTVTITATLPNAYNGTCAAKVKLKSDYSKYQYVTASFSGNTCSVNVSASALTALGTGGFIAFMNWNNNEYTAKGDHSGYEFSL